MAHNKIRIGIIGVGNCASSLIQGIDYYRDSSIDNNEKYGILHKKIGKYLVQDIECVAAFDVNAKKVGKDISEAIFVQPNCTTKFYDVPFKGVEVKKAPVLDGVSENSKKLIKIDRDQRSENVCKILKETGVDILINYLPSGSQKATLFFVNEAIKANCGFINSIPVFIASKEQYSKKFAKARLPVAGDDIKSQIGSTIVNRAIIDLFNFRGVKITKCTQTCEGGNTDFLNLSEKNRAKNKIISKYSALNGLINYKTNINIIPPRYVKGQNDNKTSNIVLEGKYFGNSTVKIQLNLEVEDSPNSAGVMVDIIRLMKLGIENNLYGSMDNICPFYFKHPKIQIDDFTALKNVTQFIQKYG